MLEDAQGHWLQVWITPGQRVVINATAEATIVQFPDQRAEQSSVSDAEPVIVVDGQ
jgi:hypothetical protein